MPLTVIASASEASAKQSRAGAPLPWTLDCFGGFAASQRRWKRLPVIASASASEREAIQKRRGNAVRPPPIPCGAARLDCVGGFAASQ
jgi:hypothetical protein